MEGRSDDDDELRGAVDCGAAPRAAARRLPREGEPGLSVKVKGGSNEVRLDLDAEGIEVGRPAPPLPAHGPDANFLHESDLRGKYVLLTFWAAGAKDPITERPFARLREVRREFAGQEKLLIISPCVNANIE